MAGVGHNSGESQPAQVKAPTVTVSLPTALVRLFPGSPNTIKVNGRSVAEVIDALDGRWPGMRDRLTDTRPAIRKHLNVFVDGEKARLDTPVASGARVTILTAVSGG
ncbi:MAG: MoaD/ThiS family protein [Alphaproteobacteria bacterium]|nr:MoaD/ThiS family protein [Alphaproteobacteria bacterium]